MFFCFLASTSLLSRLKRDRPDRGEGIFKVIKSVCTFVFTANEGDGEIIGIQRHQHYIFDLEAEEKNMFLFFLYFYLV